MESQALQSELHFKIQFYKVFSQVAHLVLSQGWQDKSEVCRKYPGLQVVQVPKGLQVKQSELQFKVQFWLLFTHVAHF